MLDPSKFGFAWGRPLFSRRMLQANCTVCYDFEWKLVIGHNHPKFPGLQDLSMAITEFAKLSKREPVLLLTDQAEIAFDELITSTNHYIAIVNIRDFLACIRKDNDRSALFFLSEVSKHGSISTASASASISFRVRQLLKVLEVGLEGKSEALIEALNKGGSRLTFGLLNAVVKCIEGSVAREDLETLTEILATSSARVITAAASTAKRTVAIREFEDLLRDDATEHKFQAWFQVNAWVLGTDCIRILDERRIDPSNVADLIIQSYDNYLDIVELKRPRARFWNTEKDHENYIPHPELTAAIIQTQNYQLALERKLDSISETRRLGGPIAKPTSLLIHGRSIDWNSEQFMAQRLLNAGFAGLRIITYDQVLCRANILLGRRPDIALPLDQSNTGR